MPDVTVALSPDEQKLLQRIAKAHGHPPLGRVVAGALVYFAGLAPATRVRAILAAVEHPAPRPRSATRRRAR